MTTTTTTKSRFRRFRPYGTRRRRRLFLIPLLLAGWMYSLARLCRSSQVREILDVVVALETGTATTTMKKDHSYPTLEGTTTKARLDHTTSPSHTSSNGTTVTTTNSVVQFVFAVGLEGTGHHLLGRIISSSPGYHRLKTTLNHRKNNQSTKRRTPPRSNRTMDSAHLYRRTMKELHQALFDGRTYNGIWNVPCRRPTPSPHNLLPNRSIDDDERTKEEGIRNVANVLRRVEKTARRNSPTRIEQQQQQLDRSDARGTTTTTRKTKVMFPVNTVTLDKEDKLLYGEASYPNFGGPCRNQQYPRLASFYQACEVAKVDCRHVYLHRDPLEILYSTTIHRRFNPTLAHGVILYEQILRTAIRPELVLYRNRSMGCLGFYNQEEEEEEVPQESQHDDEHQQQPYDPPRRRHWKSILFTLWQWQNRSKFEQTMETIYHPPHSRNRTVLLERLIHDSFTADPTTTIGTTLKSWQRSHDEILQTLC